MSRRSGFLLALFTLLVAVFAWWDLRPRPEAAQAPAPVALPVELPSPSPVPEVVASAHPSPAPIPSRRAGPIRISRVRYVNSICAPGEKIQFDVNGGPFASGEEERVSVHLGTAPARVVAVHRVTVNQLRVDVAASREAPSGISFPVIRVDGKTAFTTADPFVIVRPGEVINVVFTGFRDDGRSAQIKVFTNLTADTFRTLRIETDTDTIRVTNLVPKLPYFVDATLEAGATQGDVGQVSFRISVDGRLVWSRPSSLRVSIAKDSLSGLVQRVKADELFARGGDTVRFVVAGSGFDPDDAAMMGVRVRGLSPAPPRFEYISPSRMHLYLTLPTGAAAGSYNLAILHKGRFVHESGAAFVVVPPNWTSVLNTAGPLRAGARGRVLLSGRDLSAKFVSGLRVSLDEPGIKVGGFKRISAREASATVSVAPGVEPGDYWFRLSKGGKPVEPFNGSLVTIYPKKKR